jgi:hypothetical protein
MRCGCPAPSRRGSTTKSCTSLKISHLSTSRSKANAKKRLGQEHIALLFIIYITYTDGFLCPDKMNLINSLVLCASQIFLRTFDISLFRGKISRNLNFLVGLCEDNKMQNYVKHTSSPYLSTTSTILGSIVHRAQLTKTVMKQQNHKSFSLKSYAE